MDVVGQRPYRCTNSIHLTEAPPLCIHADERRSSPTGRIVPFFQGGIARPAGSAITHWGIIVITDGALKIDGRMGAAYVSQGNRMAAQFWAV